MGSCTGLVSQLGARAAADGFKVRSLKRVEFRKSRAARQTAFENTPCRLTAPWGVGNVTSSWLHHRASPLPLAAAVVFLWAQNRAVQASASASRQSPHSQAARGDLDGARATNRSLVLKTDRVIPAGALRISHQRPVSESGLGFVLLATSWSQCLRGRHGRRLRTPLSGATHEPPAGDKPACAFRPGAA